MHTTAQPLHVILREQLLCVLYGQFWCAGIRECLTLIMSTETSVSWRQMRLHGKSESKDHASKSQLTLSNCTFAGSHMYPPFLTFHATVTLRVLPAGRSIHFAGGQGS